MSQNKLELRRQEFEAWLENCQKDGINPLSIIKVNSNKDFNKANKPFVFSNFDEFNAAILESKKATEHYFSQGRSDSLNTIIKNSIGGSTFRSFHFKATKCQETPSSVYRDYTLDFLGGNESSLNNLIDLNNESEYENFFFEAAEGLIKKFSVETDNSEIIKFGRATKLLNLSFKRLLRSEKIPDTKREQLITLLHVPLDSYTLQGIRKLAKEFNIPRNASMGWAELDSKETYLQIQNWIRLKCKEAGGLPIHYEIAAWDLSHS